MSAILSRPQCVKYDCFVLEKHNCVACIHWLMLTLHWPIRMIFTILSTQSAGHKDGWWWRRLVPGHQLQHIVWLLSGDGSLPLVQSLWSWGRHKGDGLVQACSISSALAMEILQSCTKPWEGHKGGALVQDCSISSALALVILQSCTKPLKGWTLDVCSFSLKYLQWTHHSSLWGRATGCLYELKVRPMLVQSCMLNNRLQLWFAKKI